MAESKDTISADGQLKIRHSAFVASANLFFRTYVLVFFSSIVLSTAAAFVFTNSNQKLEWVNLMIIGSISFFLSIFSTLFVLILIASYVQQSATESESNTLGNIGIGLAVISIVSFLAGVSTQTVFLVKNLIVFF